MSKKSNQMPGFSIPGQEEKPSAPPPQIIPQGQTTAAGQKEITLMYLLQHYNKDNAALYKAQKERRKQEKEQAKAAKAAQVVPGNTPPDPNAPESPGAVTTQQQQWSDTPTADRQDRFYYPDHEQNEDQDGEFGGTIYVKHEKIIQLQQTKPEPQPTFIDLLGDPPDFSRQGKYNDGGTTDEDYSSLEETVYWDRDKDPAPQKQNRKTATLRRLTTMEEIKIAETPFKVGRNPAVVNYTIPNNLRISGYHALIDVYGDQFFIVDKGTMNGVYLNNYRIEPETEYVLTSGMIVAFADEQFVFEED